MKSSLEFVDDKQDDENWKNMNNEFDYYLIDDDGSESAPLLVGDPKYDQSSWFLIEENPVDIELPVRLCFNEPIPRKPKMVDYHSMPDSVISSKIYKVLAPLNIYGVELLPAIVRNDKTEELYDNYFVVHVFNQITCLDMERAEYSKSKVTDRIIDIEELILDQNILKDIPLEKRLVFLLKESISKRIYHKSIVDKIMASKPEGISFSKIEESKTKHMEQHLEYKDTEHHIEMATEVYKGVLGAIELMQKQRREKRKKLFHFHINAEMDWENGNINFLMLEEFRGSKIYTYKVGELMRKVGKVLDPIKKGDRTLYNQVILKLFEDAKLSQITKKEVEKLNFTLTVPEIGSEPLMEIFNNTYENVFGHKNNKDEKADLFYTKYHGAIAKTINEAVVEALKILQEKRKSEDLGFLDMTAVMAFNKGTIYFWYPEEGKKNHQNPFYTHQVGNLLIEGWELMQYLKLECNISVTYTNDGLFSESDMITHFFEDAKLCNIDKNLLEGLNFTLEADNSGNDPFMKVIDGVNK